MSDLQSLFTDCLNETLIRVILSNPSSKDGVIKICARPVLKNKSLLFQIEEYTKTQVFHKNMSKDDAVSYLCSLIPSRFLQGQLDAAGQSTVILANKKGTVTVKSKKKTQPAKKNHACP